MVSDSEAFGQDVLIYLGSQFMFKFYEKETLNIMKVKLMNGYCIKTTAQNVKAGKEETDTSVILFLITVF